MKRVPVAEVDARKKAKTEPLQPRYEPCPLHFKVPHGIFIHEATSVAVDSDDNAYCFNRGNMPVLVFDRDGNLIRFWGNSTPYAGTDRSAAHLSFPAPPIVSSSFAPRRQLHRPLRQ